MKKSNLAKKALATALALSFASAGVACEDALGGKITYDDVTIISVLNMGGGVGKAWMEKAFKRFQDSVGDKSYEDGKQGVELQIEHTTSYTLTDIKSSGYNIYFDQGQVNVQQFAADGRIMNIDDIVKGSIENKIDERNRPGLQYNGAYYALPHYELFPGVSYDVELFNKNDLYIAAPDETEIEEHSAFGVTVNFALDSCGNDGVYGTADDASKRSCGNDGVYGTADDGLPSSLLEFLVLCDKINKAGMTPFALAGSHTDYSAYFLSGLTASLSGYEAVQANYSFDGKIDVVTGYTDEQMFDNVKATIGVNLNLPKPVVERDVVVTEATGYKTRSQEARYYALAALEIIEQAGWINGDSYKPTSLHTAAQDSFIFSGASVGGVQKEKIAMLMELSQWTNEAQDSGSLPNFYSATNRNEETQERQIAWMPLPTEIYESVQEGEGNALTLIDVVDCYAFINGNIKSDGLAQACKDFLAFLYTENELKEFVANTGVTRAGISLDYGEDVMNRLNSFEKSMVETTRNSEVKRVASIGNNKTFMSNKQAFIYYTGKGAMYSVSGRNGSYMTPIDAYRAEKISAKEVFTQTEISSTDWTNKYYKN